VYLTVVAVDLINDFVARFTASLQSYLGYGRFLWEARTIYRQHNLFTIYSPNQVYRVANKGLQQHGSIWEFARE
jgi:hypothetical protein